MYNYKILFLEYERACSYIVYMLFHTQENVFYNYTCMQHTWIYAIALSPLHVLYCQISEPAGTVPQEGIQAEWEREPPSLGQGMRRDWSHMELSSPPASSAGEESSQAQTQPAYASGWSSREGSHTWNHQLWTLVIAIKWCFMLWTHIHTHRSIHIQVKKNLYIHVVYIPTMYVHYSL